MKQQTALSGPYLERLLEQYGDRVYRFCFVWLGDGIRAEKTVQEIFSKLASGAAGRIPRESDVMELTVQICQTHKNGDFPALKECGTAFQQLDFREKQAVLVRYYLGLSAKKTAYLLKIPRILLLKYLEEAKAVLSE